MNNPAHAFFAQLAPALARWQGARVLVLGLGASGLAMARWCARLGAQVTVADTRAAPPQLATLRAELPQAAFVSGALDAALLRGQGYAAVLRSPGLSPASMAPLLEAASADSISIFGELDLFSEGLQALRAQSGYAPAVLAVTGTNGKTTVTSLTGQLVARAGKSVAVAGNIGPTLLDTLNAHMEAGSLPEVWVLELSSFQLDGVQGFEPTAATVLNITQDHLDWHGSLQSYAAAKARIFGRHALMVLNREDPLVMQMLPAAAPAASNAAVGKARAQAAPQRAYLTFGGDLPRRAGDFGIAVVHGMAWLVRAQPQENTENAAPRRRARAGSDADAQTPLHLQRLMPADALRIRGRHNAVNALAALALATAAGCGLAPMLYGLREYRGEPHRVEPVAIVAGVEYFDDSKGTNVGATVAALSGLGACRALGVESENAPQRGQFLPDSQPHSGAMGQEDGKKWAAAAHSQPTIPKSDRLLGAERRIVLILGGEGKGQDFTPLTQPVARHARAVFLIGRDAPRIRAALQATGVPLRDAASLPEAVQQAAQHAQAGDAVLLSPACASLDMFRDYAHRAEVFRAAVRALALDAGQDMEGMA